MLNQKVSDEIIIQAAKDTIRQFKSSAIEYREGRDGLLGFFVGHVVKKHPDADHHIVNALTRRELDRVNLFEKSDAEKKMLKELKSQYKNQQR
jgi:Asp-tRNA(Asn)/Glu-tRNA(Gln) amidotransferase B subunit